VFQPKYAAYLHLIEPRRKILRSLALKGQRFEARAQIEQAVEQATVYWKAHKQPFIWSRRRLHRTARHLGTATPPNVTRLSRMNHAARVTLTPPGASVSLTPCWVEIPSMMTPFWFLSVVADAPPASAPPAEAAT